MASTSASSSVQKSFKYDVFLSFRGEDTLKTVVDPLYHALLQKGVTTYKDDETIEKGERISEQRIRCIEDSRFHIIVFSKNYASSSWCLDELAKIMECHKMTEYTAYPVFYDVEPTEVRNQSGPVGEAFAKHVRGGWSSVLPLYLIFIYCRLLLQRIFFFFKRFTRVVDLEEENNVARWINALQEAASLTGMELKNTFNGHETIIIQQIVKEVLLKLHFFNSSVDGNLVGMETRVIGIQGMGGGGETTSVRAVCDHTFIGVEGNSFVEDVKEVSTGLVGKRFKYDVFLSFRGEDTRKTFVDHLYHALHNRGITTYKDDEIIEKGKRINDQLMRSIEDSRIYIIVFSKNYASSSWCLDELVKIMDCHKATKQTAYPVFFNVEPTEVRHQSGAVGEAFAKHEKDEAAGIWRYAMKEAADLAGRELKTTFDGHEARFIQKIVEDISLELRFIDSSVDDKLIGMETRIKDVVSYLEDASVGVHVIGIKGIGGGGKTTLATAVFNHISYSFEGKSFVENVRENSKGFGLKKLQKQVLQDVLNDKSIDVTSVYEGKNMMKKKMGSRKVLVVLDDVDDMEQLEALAGDHTWFKSGSTIIITTRDEEVLVAHRVKFIHDVNLLSDEEAIRLFSKYAFGREIPIEGYEELSRKVVHYAAGLPLTIKVLGSSLCGKTECEWNDAIERLKTIPEKQTLKRLELSYSGLEDDHKEVFLEVACILKGEQKGKAIRILESCGLNARFALKVLEQKSLITVCFGDLYMHDRIEEMGRNIVRRLHPLEPQRHTRLWVKEEIENIFVDELGTKATLSIKLICTNLPLAKIGKGLRKMKNLRVLYITDMGCNNISQLWERGNRKVLNELKFLSLTNLRFRTFDLGLTPKLETLELVECVDLVELHMLVESPKLRSLLIYYSKLSKLELGLTPQLESLDLRICNDLVELHMPVESPKLRSLLIYGSKLSKLELGLTPQLEELYLKGCKDLVELHMPIESPKLKFLWLSESKLSKLDLGLTPQLENLDLSGCKDLVELHMPIESPKLKSLLLSGSKLSKLDLGLSPQLETLDLEGCKDLVELHMPIESPKLKSLLLSGSKLSKLDLGLSPQLETLDLEGCKDLVELHMPIESPKLKSLVISGSKLSKLNLGLIPQLKMLDLEKCYYLQEIHAPMGCLQKLVNFKISGCLRFERFVGSNWYALPRIDSLSTVELIAESLDICPLHPNNKLPKFQFKCFFDEPLPSSSGNLEKLLSFGLCACTDLESFSSSICGLQRLRKLKLEGSIPEVPKDLYQLESLQELTLCMKEIKHLPDTIFMLKHLKSLQLKSCWLLEQLPVDICILECLEELNIIDCVSLRDIPNDICQMKCLEYLHIPYCVLVDKLPDELGRLECLKELNIEGAGISHLPQSIFELKGLRIIGSRWRLESYGFTSMSTVSGNKTCCYVKL